MDSSPSRYVAGIVVAAIVALVAFVLLRPSDPSPAAVEVVAADAGGAGNTAPAAVDEPDPAAAPGAPATELAPEESEAPLDETPPEPAAESAPEPDADSEAEADSEADAGSEPDADSAAEAGPEPAPEPTAEPEVDVGKAFLDNLPDPRMPPVLGDRTELVGIEGWLNNPDGIAGLADLEGQVVIVHIWTFGCYNCKNTMPFVRAIYDSYNAEGLEIVGVHSPEFSFEKDEASIAAAAAEQGVIWPIALDHNKKSFRALQPGGTRYWPRTFVLDQSGNVRFDRIGEGAYGQLEETVAYLLENPTNV